MEIKDENVEISIFFPEKQSSLLANATVSLRTIEYGFVTIKGFCIWISSRLNDRLQEKINITPPSKQIRGRYRPIVFVEEPIDNWYCLEARIYDAYHKAKIKIKYKQKQNEDVNPNDIPF